jgi:hypothetical protein
VGSTEEFIGLYYKLWDYFLETTDSDHSMDFDELVDKAAKMNGVVKNEARRIKDFGKLSNTLRNHNLNQIAEPTENALSEFKRLVDDIICPKNLIPKFQTEIRCFSPNEKLVNALKYMRDYDFSQVIVQEGGKLTLLTVEGVANWVGGQAEKETISIAEVRVRDALLCDITDSYVVMGPKNTIYDAQEAFGKAIEKMHPRLFAIIISDTGKPTGKAIGIVTPYDLTPVDAPSSDYVFRIDGEIWNVVYEGQATRLRNLKGLRYIAYLLATPAKEFHVLDLIAEVEGIAAEGANETYSKISPEQLEKEYKLTPSFLGDAGDIIDSQTKKEIQKRLRGLHEDLAEAEKNNDLGLASKYKEEIEFLESYISQAYSKKKGRSRKAADPADKARKAVSRSITRSLRKIKIEHPSLWRHLYNSIKTGFFCSYNPETRIDWSL